MKILSFLTKIKQLFFNNSRKLRMQSKNPVIHTEIISSVSWGDLGIISYCMK